MPKLPEPPARLEAIRPEWRELPSGTLLWSIDARVGDHPGAWDAFRRYGPLGSARFDHHLPPPREQERAILYAALDVPTCLAEVFQATRVLDRARREPWLVAFRTTEPLRLLDLDSVWPTRAGASMAIASGRRDRARRWSQAIYAAYSSAQGLWYPASMRACRPDQACTSCLQTRASTGRCSTRQWTSTTVCSADNRPGTHLAARCEALTPRARLPRGRTRSPSACPGT